MEDWVEEGRQWLCDGGYEGQGVHLIGEANKHCYVQVSVTSRARGRNQQQVPRDD